MSIVDAPRQGFQQSGDQGSKLVELAKVVQTHFADHSSSAATQNYIVQYITRAYLDALHIDAAPHPQFVEQQLLKLINTTIEAENKKGETVAGKLAKLKTLNYWQVAQILLKLHHVIRIAPNAKDTDREYDLLAMYKASGPAAGTYSTSEDDIRTTARRYNTQMTLNEFKELMAVLREDSPRTFKCTHPDLIAARNGIVFYGSEDATLTINGATFDFTAKGLHPFDPALVFLTKHITDYVPDAPKQLLTDPVDGSTWEVGEWMHTLSDDPGVPELLWEIIGAMLRPHVNWGKTAWFYSEQGNNGKGTLCALMRNLIGPQAHTSIPLTDFGKEFALEPLVRASAIIVDENDVGTFIDKAANLKAIVTNDVIQINRKYRMPIAFQFHGFMVQCLNEFPRVKDKSESFYRRQLFVPFTKSFTGREKKHIKDDFLQRREVLEYVMWYAINRAGAASPGSYYQLSEPPATQEVLHEYKEFNDPVRAFWEEFRARFSWDLLPFPFLYELYKAWHKEVAPSGLPVSRQQFIPNLLLIIRPDAYWHCPDKKRPIRPAQMMSSAEPLIAEFDLKNWMNPTYSGSDPNLKCKPILRANYRGILRQQLTAVPGAADDDTTD